jgi:hypothetical protein
MAPHSVTRGACEAGIGQRRECFDRVTVLLGRRHPATGSHLPLEDTAPPFAVAPFASSLFAHPIPQSHRRASGDLFRAALTFKKHHWRGTHPWLNHIFLGLRSVTPLFE